VRPVQLLFASALWFAPACAVAAPFTPAEIAEIDRVANETLAKSGAPSVSVAVVRDRRIVFARAYGFERLPGVHASIDTRYNIGSVSKQFTAAAVLMLAEDGRLSLNDHVGRFFPGVSGGDSVDLTRLLSHTAGYRSYWSIDYLPLAMKRPVAPQVIVDRWASLPLDYQPGARWTYSNTDYVMAGRIVEITSGSPLAAFLHTRIFKPLDMASASPWIEPGTHKAVGYSRYALGPTRIATPVPAGWEFAAGGLGMSASDLARWDMAMLDARLLKPASWAAQQTEIKLTDGSGSGYGLGVYVREAQGHRRIRHDGSTDGFITENRVYPDEAAAIVVVTNADFGNVTRPIADRIEAMLETPDVVQAFNVRPKRDAWAPPTAPDPTPVLKEVIDQLARGRLDRVRLTANAADFFTGDILADYNETFRRLGPPKTVTLLRHNLIDGLDAGLFKLDWDHQSLIAILRIRADGKIEEFTASPAG
jgi:D-alanyl-D-alanine carboxypeptidase